MSDFIEDIAERAAYERAMLLDRELYELLKTHNIPFEGRVDELRATLKSRGLELIQDIQETPTARIYQLKLCKLLDTHTISIPKVVL